MDVIDHGILIPVPPDRVWQVMSDINHLPHWHTDCRSVAFLTSLRSGPGTRWRFVNKRGAEYVMEITAWYDKLGFEYQYVDGVSLKENRGMMRLQEVPEGTVVQWTFSYRTGGLLSRNSLGSKRTINNTMVDSLRSLYRYMTRERQSQSEFEAKSLMRDAPDVDARAHYKPRHPSVLEEKQIEAPQTQNALPGTRYLDPFYEPPVAQDDTRPRPVVAAPGPTPASIEEPDFIKNEPDSGFARRPSDTIRLDQTNAEAPTHPNPSIMPPIEIQPPHPEPDIVEQREVPTDLGTVPLPPLPPSGTPVTDTLPELQRFSPVEDSDFDSSQVSVFELFGLPKPSETQEMRAIAAGVSKSGEPELKVEMAGPSTMPLPAIHAAPSAAAIEIGRVGLRISGRRKLVKLRQPS